MISYMQPCRAANMAADLLLNIFEKTQRAKAKPCTANSPPRAH